MQGPGRGADDRLVFCGDPSAKVEAAARDPLVGVQVGEDIARGDGASRRAGVRDADSLVVADDADSECLEAETGTVARGVVDDDDFVVAFRAGANGFKGSKDFGPSSCAVRITESRTGAVCQGIWEGAGTFRVCGVESTLSALTLKRMKEGNQRGASRERV